MSGGDLAHMVAVLDHMAARLTAAAECEDRERPADGDGLALSLAAGEARHAAWLLRGVLG